MNKTKRLGVTFVRMLNLSLMLFVMATSYAQEDSRDLDSTVREAGSEIALGNNHKAASLLRRAIEYVHKNKESYDVVRLMGFDFHGGSGVSSIYGNLSLMKDYEHYKELKEFADEVAFEIFRSKNSDSCFRVTGKLDEMLHMASEGRISELRMVAQKWFSVCEGDLLEKLRTTYIQVSLFDGVEHEADRMFEGVSSSLHKRMICGSLAWMGDIYRLKQLYSKSFLLIDYAERKCPIETASHIYLSKMILYADIGDYKNAEIYYQRGVESLNQYEGNDVLGKGSRNVIELSDFQEQRRQWENYLTKPTSAVSSVITQIVEPTYDVYEPIAVMKLMRKFNGAKEYDDSIRAYKQYFAEWHESNNSLPVVEDEINNKIINFVFANDSNGIESSIVLYMADAYLGKGDMNYSKGVYETCVKKSSQVHAVTHAAIQLISIYKGIDDNDRVIKTYQKLIDSIVPAMGARGAFYQKHMMEYMTFLAKSRNYTDMMSMQAKLGVSESDVLSDAYVIPSEDVRKKVVGQSVDSMHAFLSIAASISNKDIGARERAYELLLNRKGILFDMRSLQIESMIEQMSDDDKKLWDKVVGLKSRKNTNNLMSRGEGGETDSIVERIETDLSKKYFQIKNLPKKKPLQLTDIVKAIPVESIYLDYIKVKRFDVDRQEFTRHHDYYVFSIDSNGNFEMHSLGDAVSVEKMISNLTNRLKTELDSDVVGDDDAGIYHDLYRAILQPALMAPNSYKNIIVSPDSAITLVPFGALVDLKDRYLIENHTIHYVSSGRELLNPKRDFDNTVSLFLAANPLFDNKQEPKEIKPIYQRLRALKAAGRFSPLPGSALEAKQLPQIITGENKIVLTRGDATEDAVLSIKSPRILHLATHGFFLGNIESNSDELGNNNTNPLLMSGLAFAGANNAVRAKNSNDGLLTALEVTGMDLRGTELVALSACQSGLGSIRSGDGVYGLRRAFSLAGAKSILMSLWSVSDELTAYQMKEFYKEYTGGIPASSALRRAQLSTMKWLKKYHGTAPPALWAPFILQGEF